jgi:hypothetical protein
MKRNSSHMQMILPEDVHWRLAEFMQGRKVFPFIENNELVCIFYLYLISENHDELERKKAVDVATQTVKRISFEINKNTKGNSYMDSDMVRELYLKRQLQIAVDQVENINFRYDQILNDPIILSYCFSQHVSYYKQDYFFQIYGPLNEGEYLNEMRSTLQGAMIMLGFNRKDETMLPFKHPLIPLYIWLKDHQIRVGL